MLLLAHSKPGKHFAHGYRVPNRLQVEQGQATEGAEIVAEHAPGRRIGTHDFAFTIDPKDGHGSRLNVGSELLFPAARLAASARCIVMSLKDPFQRMAPSSCRKGTARARIQRSPFAGVLILNSPSSGVSVSLPDSAIKPCSRMRSSLTTRASAGVASPASTLPEANRRIPSMVGLPNGKVFVPSGFSRNWKITVGDASADFALRQLSQIRVCYSARAAHTNSGRKPEPSVFATRLMVPPGNAELHDLPHEPGIDRPDEIIPQRHSPASKLVSVSPICI